MAHVTKTSHKVNVICSHLLIIMKIYIWVLCNLPNYIGVELVWLFNHMVSFSRLISWWIKHGFSNLSWLYINSHMFATYYSYLFTIRANIYIDRQSLADHADKKTPKNYQTITLNCYMLIINWITCDNRLVTNLLIYTMYQLIQYYITFHPYGYY